MRGLKKALVLASAMCAVCVAATPAAAHEFTARRLPKQLSEAEPAKTKGVGIGSSVLGGEERSQELKFGAFTIDCSAQASGKTISEGAVSWATSQIFATEVKFSKCLAKANYGTFSAGTPTKFNVNPSTKKSEPVKFVYHVNGFAQFGAGEVESEVQVGSGSAVFSVGGKTCNINWPSQTVPAKAALDPSGEFSSATYSTEQAPASVSKKFPTGIQDKLIITNEFKGMEWFYEEGQCIGEGGFEVGAKTEEAKNGVYKGTLEETLNGGSLSFQ